MFPSRLVALVDELQDRGLVQRLENPRDRRIYLLQVTARGKEVLQSIGRVAREHQDALLAALNTEERGLLASLLSRVADHQGLRPGVHSGFARLHQPTTDNRQPTTKNRQPITDSEVDTNS